MKFAGLCSYPHGGYTVLGLLLSGAAAMTTTLYAAASCRFLTVTFVSETGNFETYFTNIQEAAAGRPALTYKVGIGLFQFLRPFRDDRSWSDGSCAGFQESMLHRISDTPFETSRFFAVIAVVFSFILVIWEVMMIFAEFNRVQITTFCFVAMMGTLCCGMTFMVTKSVVCNEIFLERQCELDEGGMVMIAACMMWFTTLVLSTVFLRPPKHESGSRLTKKERAKIAAELDQKERRNERSWASELPETGKAYSLESSLSGGDEDDDDGRRRMGGLRATIAKSRQRSMESSSRSMDESSQFTEGPSRYARLMSRSRKPETSGNKRKIARDRIVIDDESHPDSMEVYISNSPSYR